MFFQILWLGQKPVALEEAGERRQLQVAAELNVVSVVLVVRVASAAAHGLVLFVKHV